MRYHFEKPKNYIHMYGDSYICNHPVYDRCTLYIINNFGLAIIQQRYDETTKHTYWSEIDSCLTDEVYLNERFIDYFTKYAKEKDKNGLYPTVTIRQIMWALKMKPLKREQWETYFDHSPI